MLKRIGLLTVLCMFVLGASCCWAEGEYGKVKGTITWQYNNYVGTKGDVEAKIQLIPKNFDKNNITLDDEKSWYMRGHAPKNSNIFITKADGYGNYELEGVPVGEYLAVIVSNKAKRDTLAPVPSYIKNRLLDYVKNWEDFQLFVLGSGKIEIRTIEVRPNFATTVSHDFGNTYY